MLTALAHTSSLQTYIPYFTKVTSYTEPRRKFLDAPVDNGTFIKALKQSFIRNPRMMGYTTKMIALLAGWAGDGRPITTTQSVIAKKLGRSRRQVIRYLKDAMEEGYLRYSRTKDRIGRYTGIKIWLNFGAIRRETGNKHKNIITKAAETLDVTDPSQTNDKDNYILESDPRFETWHRAFCQRHGIDPPT